MEMKKVAFTVVFAAASLSAVLAATAQPPAAATTTSTGAVPAQAPGPSTSGAATLGSFVGASLLSFVAYYMQF